MFEIVIMGEVIIWSKLLPNQVFPMCSKPNAETPRSAAEKGVIHEAAEVMGEQISNPLP